MSSALQLQGRCRVGDLEVCADLEVGDGETVAILGPNGAGKTSLLRMVCGLLPLTDGTLRLDGTTLDEPASGRFVPTEDRPIGVVFQDLLLFPHLDAVGNVTFGLRARGRRRGEARELATGWLERLGVAGLATARPTELSGGEAQRVALARALAIEPRALLLDEPLAALDAEVRHEVRRVLREHLQLHRGPCLLVTHDLVDAAVLADRVVVLEAGAVTATGTLEDLVARPRTRWGAELAGTNLLPASAVGARLELAGGAALVTAEPPGDGPVLVAVRPSAVALHAVEPEGSPRNVWAGTVAEVEGLAERVRVQLAGPVPLVAEVTAAAARDMGIVPGATVWASVKATEVRAYLR
ncbi:MAG: ABC transporter ATP-binding protein [Acidimicrobiales bacterium]|nr:ABC transporter ATP-binding protein [Acidimicrobiales bacterium]